MSACSSSQVCSLLSAEMGSFELRPARDRLTLPSDNVGEHGESRPGSGDGVQDGQKVGWLGLTREDSSQAEHRVRVDAMLTCFDLTVDGISSDDNPSLPCDLWINSCDGSMISGTARQSSHLMFSPEEVILQNSHLRHVSPSDSISGRKKSVLEELVVVKTLSLVTRGSMAGSSLANCSRSF